MKLETIEKTHYYHIYNRGIDGTVIFKNDENKSYFLKLFGKYISPCADVFAFCLMDNHFHFLLKINSENDETTKAFSNFFNAYAKAFNKYSGRTGSLFEKHFKRKKIVKEAYFKNTLIYIHKNPCEINRDYQTYLFSSYAHYLNRTQPLDFQISKEFPLSLFDTIENMKLAHSKITDEDLQGACFRREHLAGQTKNESQELQGSQNHNSEDLQSFKNLVVLKKKLSMKEKFVTYIQNLQNEITDSIEKLDGTTKFKEDTWVRPEGGGGVSRVIENGAVFEKGGVNISEVYGELPESMQKYFGVTDANFFACGLSLVLHPNNPMVPTVHANWRYFELYDVDGNIADQWFGGGQDLTPYYLFEEDAKHFHQVCKTACDKHNPNFYLKYKERCDTYFYNAHREEGRGIGGLFFDYCKATREMSMQGWYNFVTEVGDSFLESYVPIVEKRKDLSYTEANKDWQEIRRGRYVEFNLVHDKGTLFGLKTNGRIESILMSLPPKVQWVYDHHPKVGSEEEKLVNVLKNPKDWI